MRLSSSSKRCFMGFNSGDFEFHGNTLMLSWVRKSMHGYYCFMGPGIVLSLCRSTTVCICGCTIRLRRNIFLDTHYVCLRLNDIAVHIMTLPPPNISTSWTETWLKRSFRRLYTRDRPSHIWRRNRDSSLNQIRRQSRPSRYDTNEHMHVWVPASNYSNIRSSWPNSA